MTDSSPTPTLWAGISRIAARYPGQPAITAPGRRALDYRGLHDHLEELRRSFRARGIGRNDRVAIVLPNGPEMAVAFGAVAGTATAAPLNPAYRAEEYEFYLNDLGARALLVGEGADTPARTAAAILGIPVVEIAAESDGPAGRFTLRSETGYPPLEDEPVRAGDIALVLHTSGTTSRPKIVPLSQQNLAASAANIRQTLNLTGTDRCLNVMPLFHIHGLMGVVASTLTSGGSIVCCPGFDEERFFDWAREFSPTWYSAVPTMHQAVLARLRTEPGLAEEFGLRFIRSSSASLPPDVMEELRTRFGAPVIEAYGMTEAAHQMASNPLPPGRQKPGSVGCGTGVAISIMDPAGEMLPAGAEGEIVIRGPNVTAGYENNPEANSGAFRGEWFRTGDQGYLDEDGYLFISGRIKEIVNRGGEKISPREVDEVLTAHPHVFQAVAFAVPHERLGEDLAAVVVPEPGAGVTEGELRAFALERLAEFKVPGQIVFTDRIPKGPTGKLQRIGLWEQLEDLLSPEHARPEGAVEETIAALWSDILGRTGIGRTDNFFRLGGDSLAATRVTTGLTDAFGVQIPIIALFTEPTVAGLAREVSAAGAGAGEPGEADLRRALDEVESLSEDEVDRRLARTGRDEAETGPGTG